MKYYYLLIAFLSLEASACWNMKAVMSVDENTIKIDQKIDHDKTYSFASGNYIFNIKIPTDSKKPGMHLVQMAVAEKSGITLKPISNGGVWVKPGSEASMTSQDSKNEHQTSIKVTLTEI